MPTRQQYLDLQSTQKQIAFGLESKNTGYMGHYFGYFGGPGTGMGVKGHPEPQELLLPHSM